MTTAGLGTRDSGQEPKASDTNDKVVLLLQQLPSLSFSVPSPKSLVPPFLSEDFLRNLFHRLAAVAGRGFPAPGCQGTQGRAAQGAEAPPRVCRLPPLPAHDTPDPPASSAGPGGSRSRRRR